MRYSLDERRQRALARRWHPGAARCIPQDTEGKVPTVDNFAANFTGAVQWPAVPNWQVTGGTFASAFLLGGHASS
jgi:hypothetical protein